MTHIVGTYFNAVHHLENNSLYLTRLETYIFLLKMLTSNSRGRILKKYLIGVKVLLMVVQGIR